MYGSDEIVKAIDEIVKTNLIELVVWSITVTTILLLLKSVAEAAAGYIQLRLDKHIAIGSPVEVYTKRGRIKEIHLFTVTIETECGYIRVPTKEWRTSRFLILKDKVVLRNRRSTDEGVKNE